MDWFKRYGIVGTHFLGLLFAWLYVLFPTVIYRIMSIFGGDGIGLVALVVLSTMPVGYILGVLQYLLYFAKKKHWLHEDALARYKKRKNECCWNHVYDPSFYEERHEKIREVYSCTNIAGHAKDAVDAEKWKQEWFRKRIDLIIINRILLISTVLAPAIAIAAGLGLGCAGMYPFAGS